MTDFTDCEIINYGHVGEKFLDTINNLKTYDRERNLSPEIPSNDYWKIYIPTIRMTSFLAEVWTRVKKKTVKIISSDY